MFDSNRPHRHRNLFALGSILLAVLVVYGQTLHVPWYLDDYVTIVNAPQIRDVGAAFGNLFTPRGVANFSFALNYRLGGLALPGYHLVNLAIHAATSLLVGLLLRRVAPGRPVLPLLGALLFAVHPVQTQAITYVTQRMTSLAALFVLLCLYLYVRARETQASSGTWRTTTHLGFYLGALMAGILALYSKENAAVFPALLLIFDLFFLPREGSTWQRRLLYLTPFFLAALIYSGAHYVLPLLHGTGLNALTGYHDTTTPVTPLRYLVTEFSVLWIYLRLFFLPYGQVIEYKYPVITAWLTVQNLAAGIGLAALICLAWGLRRRVPLFAFGMAWFLISLAVESSIIPLDPLFEHRLYLPLFGLIVALLGLSERLPRPALNSTLLGVFLLLMAFLAWQRNRLWNDPPAFYGAAVQAQPQNAKMLAELALARLDRGESAGVEPLLRRALALNPRNDAPQIVLFSLLLQQRRYDEAEAQIRQAALAGCTPQMILEMRQRLAGARH